MSSFSVGETMQSHPTLPAKVSESLQNAACQGTKKPFSLFGTTTVVTGAGQGLGINLAIAIVEAGGNVACLDILSEPVDAGWTLLQKAAESSKCWVAYYMVDITKKKEMQEVFDLLASEAQRLNAPLSGTIACAGVQQRIPALEYPVEDFERILRVNVAGTFLTAQQAAKVMVRNGTGGSIILIASMSGQIANRGLTCSAYNSSKAAVQQMCRSLAQEWGQYGIRVNTISPGYIRTTMTDMLLQAEPSVEQLWMAGALLGRLGVPEDFKGPAVFLLGSGSSFMTGADLRVDGGHCASS